MAPQKLPKVVLFDIGGVVVRIYLSLSPGLLRSIIP